MNDYRHNAEVVLRLMRDRGRVLPDYMRASTQGNIPRGRRVRTVEHPMSGRGCGAHCVQESTP